MSRTFKKVDYDRALDLTVRLGDCLPLDHLACFVVDSVAQLDLSALYAQYGSRGGEPYAPEMLLSLLLYEYATGVFSSRKMERTTGRRPGGRPPTPPITGPRDGDQYNFSATSTSL